MPFLISEFRFKPNALGFYDLGGNVAESMLDGFDVKNPKSDRVLRGGYWYSLANFARSAYRYVSTPSVASNFYGFRLARGRL
jgi:formylglycine-generating enzyme required for sulfatase activity